MCLVKNSPFFGPRWVAALALGCISLGIYAYYQQTALATAEALIRSLQTQESAAPPAFPETADALDNAANSESTTADASVGAEPKDKRGGGKARRGPEDFAKMMDTPEMQQLMNLRDRGMLDSRYAELFKKLALPPEQLKKLQQLLVDKQSTVRDVLAAMRSQGLTPNQENAERMRSLVKNANAELDRQIESALGATAYAQYQNYESTQPQRATVERMQQRLSYSADPMTSQQASSLVEILSRNIPPPPAMTNPVVGQPRGVAFGNGNGSGAGASITPQAIEQSRAILTPSQVNTLIAIQQEKDAQAQLARRMRQNLSAPSNPAMPRN